MEKNRKLLDFVTVDFIIVTLILILAFTVRLYKINTPLADTHSWRQVDTAAVARNFVKDGFDLLHPRYDDLSDKQYGPNPKGYHFVELPLYNAAMAFLYQRIPLLPLEVYGRLLSLLFSLLLISILYYLALRESGRVTAFFSSLVYAIMPFFVFYSRVVLPETTALSITFLSVLFLYLFSKEKTRIRQWIYFCAAVIMFAIALLIKPMVIFYVIVLLYLFFRKYSFAMIKHIAPYIFIGASLLPLYLWRTYIQNYPEGIPISGWLITSVHTSQGLESIFFKPAFFRWIFFERINNIILGGYLSFFVILGVVSKVRSYLIHAVFVSAALYLFVFQGGNVQHEYYQILILPALALMTGLGISALIKNQKNYFTPWIIYPILTAVFLFSLAMSYYKVKDNYSYPADLVQIANIIRTLTKEQDLVITDRHGDTTLLYLANRRGSPVLYKELPQLKQDGYIFFITMEKDTIEKVKKEYQYDVMFENDKFALFKL